MSKWIIGEEIIKKFNIQPIELMEEFVIKQRLLPHNQAGQMLSPLDIMEVYFKEIFINADHTIEYVQIDSDDVSSTPTTVPIAKSKSLEITINYYRTKLKQVTWPNFKIPKSHPESSYLLTSLKQCLFCVENARNLGIPISATSRCQDNPQRTFKLNTGVTFVSLKDLADLKGLSVFTLRKYAREDKMPHQRSGRKIMVDPTAFDEWFQRKRSPTSASPNALSLDDVINNALL
jgi:hypothetical protein